MTHPPPAPSDLKPADQMQELVCHPLTRAPMVRSLSGGVARTTDGNLVFSYHLSGDMARLLIPSSRVGGQFDGLWEHTCFEAFISIAGESGYRELNFSPSGQWASYGFSAYRSPATGVPHTPPQISAQLTAGHLHLVAIVAGDILPSQAVSASLRIGLSAVIETTDTADGNRSYWALCHPEPKPDFHHPDGFVLEIPSPHP